MPRITPISLGGSGPLSANVKNTATITAAAANTTRPECQCGLEVVVLGDGAADQRALRQHVAETVDGGADRLARRVAVGDRPDHAPPLGARDRREDPCDAAVGGDARRDGRRVTVGRDDLQCAGRAVAEGLLDLGVAGARAVTVGDDLDRRHPGLQAQHRDGEREQRDDRECADATGRFQRRSPHAAKRVERCSAQCTHGSDPLSMRGPSLASTAGSSVSVAARMKSTASMIPSAIDRNAGLGTSITAVSEINTVTPENSTALPAVSIVSATASVADSSDPKNAARKRITMNSA